MSTEQKETRMYKVLRDMSNERPVTPMVLRATIVLELWDGQEIPPEILPLIQKIINS